MSITKKRLLIVGTIAVALLLISCGLLLWTYCVVLPQHESQYWTNREKPIDQPAQLMGTLERLSCIVTPVEQLRLRSVRFYAWTEDWAARHRGSSWKGHPKPCSRQWRRLTFSESGGLKSEEHFKGDKRHGVRREWNDDGVLTFEAYDRNGLRHGVTRLWAETGELFREDRSVDGLLDGQATEYRSDGTVRTRGTYLNGKPWEGTFSWILTANDSLDQVPAVINCASGVLQSAMFVDGRPMTNAHITVYGCNLETQTMHLAKVRIFFQHGTVTRILDAEGRPCQPSELRRKELRPHCPFMVQDFAAPSPPPATE